ncbi:MAG: twin-arginine translocase TatA/TatE family subunit [Deltaproteobacteria bacterium]|jgi:sec-independent protein translocase protein TatB|nr:twin-arginine translocase TatA/TatE family subunit [Deltaproteobacteria bacterium]
MFGISSFEFLLILLVALMVLGPDKLPKIMRTFTKVMFEFRRVKTDFQRVMNTELAFQEQVEREQQQKKLERGIQARQQAEQQAEQQARQQAAPDIETQPRPDADQQADPVPDASTGGLTQTPLLAETDQAPQPVTPAPSATQVTESEKPEIKGAGE